MPDLSRLAPLRDERIFLFRSPEVTLRAQRRSDRFQLERMAAQSRLTRSQETWEITEAEFTALRALAPATIVRDSYLLHDAPQLTLKIYRGRHTGLVRAEIEFVSEDEARAYVPEPWMGAEMTDSLLAHDANLLDMSDEEFQRLLTGFH